MYTVGRVGTYIAQGVYTVSGPFHPFGGAVDIIVVQQEDGTFKSSPWYVKFGKFQGVLKRREKKVVVAVNGNDADFHMYLDHKGEAYFLKDAQGDDAAALSPTEAASSGDESSSHILSLEYPKRGEGSDTRAEPGKEESEDERGYDLELRFEGREASKQLIQQAVEERETVALAREEVDCAQGNFTTDIGIRDSLRDVEPCSIQNSPGTLSEPSESVRNATNRNGSDDKVMHALLSKAVGLDVGKRPTPASALVANAALAALKSAALPNDKNSKDASTTERRTSSSNGMIIHGLLNQAIGLEPSHSSGPATALVATSVLASLQRVVSGTNLGSSRASSVPKLVEVLGENPCPENNEHTVGVPPTEEVRGARKENIQGQTSFTDCNAMESLTRNGKSSHDVMLMEDGNLLESHSGEKGVDERGITAPPVVYSQNSNVQVSEITRILEVRKMEVLGEALVVEVEELEEKILTTSTTTGKERQSEEENDVLVGTTGRVRSIMIDCEQIIERVNDLQGYIAQDEAGANSARNLEEFHEQDTKPEGGDPKVGVHVDKLLVESLGDALLHSDDLHPKVSWVGEKDVATPAKDLSKIRSEETTHVGGPEVTPANKELAVVNPMTLTNIGSPRLKAAFEQEMAWRDVMEKAAAALKVAPYNSKKLSVSQSFGKNGSRAYSGSVQKKPDSNDGVPEQAEKKTWGGWFWGGSSAPQSKQSAEQNSLKDPKNVQRGSSPEPIEQDLASDELGDQSGVVSDVVDITKNGCHEKQGIHGSRDSKTEVGGKDALSVNDLGPGRSTEPTREGIKTGNEEGRLEDQGESSSDGVTQTKIPGGKRRSIFGILTRSNTNQSSLSSSSSLHSNDDLQPMLDGLKRDTSLERAECVVDLLDARWARGSKGSKDEVMAVARVPHGSITMKSIDTEVEIGFFEFQNAGSTPKHIDLVGCSMDVEGLEDRTKGNGLIDNLNLTMLGMEGLGGEPVIKQLEGKLDSNSRASEYDQIMTIHKKVDAEDFDGHQGEIKAGTNGLQVENTLTTVAVSGEGLVEFIPTLSKEVVLSSVDGHLLTAPLLSINNEPPRAYLELDESVHNDNMEDMSTSEGHPQRSVCFAEMPEERSTSSFDTHNSLGNEEGQMQRVEGARLSGQDSQELDRYIHDGSIRNLKASPNSEGLMELANSLPVDDRGVSLMKLDDSHVHNIEKLASGFMVGELGPSLVTEKTIEIDNKDIGTRDRTDGKDFDEIRTPVFEKLDEPGDIDGVDSPESGLERYYSSKDLIETEENGGKNPFKRNASVYMDAISGEGDEEVNQELIGSTCEAERNLSMNKSIPIVIPGALQRIKTCNNGVDSQISRIVSESLPNARKCAVHAELPSPRLTLSRSLGSEPLPMISVLNRNEQSASYDATVTPNKRDIGAPLKCLRRDSEGVIATETMTDNKGKSQQPNEGTHERSTGSGMMATVSGSVDDGEKGLETGFELSLCRHLLVEGMGLEAAAKVFSTQRVTFDDFKKSGSAIAANDKLVVRIGGRYYPWVFAAPIVLGILAFGEVLTAPNEGAIAVEQPVVVVGGKASTSALTTTSSGGWKLWPFGSMRRPKTSEMGPTLVSQDAFLVATEAALKNRLAKEYLRTNGYYMRSRKVRTNSPSSQQLASLNLKEGSNKITFTFVTRVLGKQQVDARIFLWKWNARIVISDVDGTITKSDVLGQVMPLVGKDWTQSGVARLFSAIEKNGYELMFLSARAISQAYLTRQFLENINQDGEVLPDGPVVISPDGLFPSLYREVIRRAPHEFKIACLEDIKSLFPPESKPFYAGFGNRDTDELSYLKVGISKGKIFIINPKGEVVVNNQLGMKSYTSLHKLVDDMFPAINFTEQEDYNEWNFWKLPLPDIDDEPSVKSSGSSSSRRGSKLGRH